MEPSVLNDIDIVKTDDKLIFDPYNSNNHEVNENHILDILERYGLPRKIHNIALYRRAFVHRSYTKRPRIENERENIEIVDCPSDCMKLKTKSNERLEFLGDGVLDCITKYYLYRRFPKENEGFMTEKKIALVKNESIGKIAYEMKLFEHFIISRHAEEKGTRTNLKKLGCLFEAFLGAIFLDFNKVTIKDEDKMFSDFFVCGPGFQMCQKFVENIFERHVDWISLIKNDDNYKNILQVKLQKLFKNTPSYVELDKDDDGYNMGIYLCVGKEIHELHNKELPIELSKISSLESCVDIIEEQGYLYLYLTSSKHKIKKKAEQMACKLAIEMIEEQQKIQK